MAIARMTKVMIASHCSEAADLLAALQQAGIVEILNAEQAMVSKEWPELQIETQRPKDLEDMVARLEKSIEFLKEHATEEDQTGVFKPLIEIDQSKYSQVVGDKDSLELLEKTEQKQSEIERLETEYENIHSSFKLLVPWKSLETPVEDIGDLRRTICISGLIPDQHFEDISGKLAELGAAIQLVGTTESMHACLVVCLNESAGDVQKALRSADFEVTSFEGMTGTVGSLLAKTEEKMALTGVDLESAREKAGEFSKDRLSLQILFDHYQNLLDREHVRSKSPMTEHVVLLEGWVKCRDFGLLKKVVGKFGATSVDKIDIAEGEEAPVEIDNNAAFRPFEVITRLYGMPSSLDFDPTVFLAPFFVLFFGLCLTDAGYGIIMVAVLWWAIKKMQGGKGALWMLLICSVMTIVAGALTGGWFGDAIQALVPEKYGWVNEFREKIMLFDPITNPMPFFKISLALGYVQIMVGLLIAFFNNLRHKEYAAAVCENLSWLVFLNSIVLYAVTKKTSPELSAFFGIVVLSQVFVIFFFTERKSGMSGRIGGGAFALFSTVFYLGDILSYVRLMALGMVTAGLGIAVNILVKLVMDVPYIGWLLGAVFFIGGHIFNMGMSTLSAFVHSLRLQFVEFFPKFLSGGGHAFKPMKEEYRHVKVESWK